jgi:hypothetical protein
MNNQKKESLFPWIGAPLRAPRCMRTYYEIWLVAVVFAQQVQMNWRGKPVAKIRKRGLGHLFQKSGEPK